ncbi:hypothetical protein [Lachnoclostridium sp. Marseille-P6806]|uniref:hypothetical protein n=1 Tax=Lachnoclostridium sp. Marseille-P6806 TaxID=2364793 RepID=UPI0010315F23|nr:hypothetical protein [Lachnoclostridium sp. Marseille-P6806]
MKHTEKQNQRPEERAVFPVDRAVFALLDRYLFPIAALFLFIGSLYIRRSMIYFASGDYLDCIVVWVEQYRALGLRQGLASTIGDYYVPYNLILALASVSGREPYAVVGGFSVLMEYVGAGAAAGICRGLLEEKGVTHARRLSVLAALALLYIPEAAMNGALWKQCDAVHTGFILVSLYFLLRERYSLSFAFLALGFVFKLQTLFVLPFYLIFYAVRRRFSILQFLWLPAMYLLAGLPAILLGRDAAQTYGVYFSQTGHYQLMTLNAPNIWSFGMTDYPSLKSFALVLTAAVFACMLIFIAGHAERLWGEHCLLLAGWSVMTCFMFLPAMHERYDYAAIVLLTAYALLFCRKMLIPAAGMIVCGMVSYGNALFASEAGIGLLPFAALYCACWAAVTAGMIRIFGRRDENAE